MAITKSQRRDRIRMRIRKRLSGSSASPRLSVYRSNKEIYVQLIDDVKGVTLATASSMEKEIASKKINKIEKAKLVGAAIAKKAVASGFQVAVFDRGGYLFHGRVKALADAARENGLKF
ncbi:MAG: 50S ribosomal protein L18 [Bacteroidetes bacterium]|nr:50S ribosomal protein L18 [Bacteroidota bacterium]